MQVVSERPEDVVRRSVVLERSQPPAAEQIGQRLRALAGAGEAVIVVVERAAVVNIEEIEAECLGRGPLEDVADEDHIAVRLRHLLAAEAHRCDVDPVTHETRSSAVRRFALRDLGLVMRIDEVPTAAVDVDRKAEMPIGHRRTLQVPSGSPTAKRARPGRPFGDATP